MSWKFQNSSLIDKQKKLNTWKQQSRSRPMKNRNRNQNRRPVRLTEQPKEIKKILSKIEVKQIHI